MVYTIIFLNSDRFDDSLWFLKPPKVGDVLKIGMLDSDGEELEYWVIVEIDGPTVKVSQQ